VCQCSLFLLWRCQAWNLRASGIRSDHLCDVLMLEKDIQAYILKNLRALDSSWWVKPTITNLVGCPDVLGFYKGKGLAIEIKRPGCHPSPKQEFEMSKIAKAGGIVFVATSWKEVKEELWKRKLLNL